MDAMSKPPLPLSFVAGLVLGFALVAFLVALGKLVGLTTGFYGFHGVGYF